MHTDAAHVMGVSSPPQAVAEQPSVAAKASERTAGKPKVPLEPLTWTRRLLGPTETPTWLEEGQRLLFALGLASLFGAAVGLRWGGPSIALYAAGVAAGILAVVVLAVPAFAVVLALADSPVDGIGLARATTRAAAKGGLVLAGLAPAAALYVVTVEDAITVTMVAFGGLLLAGAIAGRSFWDDLLPELKKAADRTRYAMAVAMPVFLLFAAVLAVRVWWVTLPALGGAL